MFPTPPKNLSARFKKRILSANKKGYLNLRKLYFNNKNTESNNNNNNNNNKRHINRNNYYLLVCSS